MPSSTDTNVFGDPLYDEAYGPRNHRTRARVRRQFTQWVEDYDILLVEMKIDAELLAKANVRHWRTLTKEQQSALAAAEGQEGPTVNRAHTKPPKNKQDPIFPDPPLPPPPPAPVPAGAPINAKPSGIDAATRKAFLKGRRKTKSKRVKGLPSHWFLPVKEEVDD